MDTSSWWKRPSGTTPGGIVAVVVATALVASASTALVTRWTAAPVGSCDVAAVAARSLPAVVTVLAHGQSGSGSGSGAVIDSAGVIITNDHVIAPAGQDGTLDVLLTSGEQLGATLVGTDPLTDLAVLRIDKTGLPVLRVAADDTLAVGQPVVALGAPLGLSGTVTSGIVSALGRDVPVPKAGGGSTVLIGAVQTDASINPGNSGGPLVDCDGALVGVNTAISTVPNAEGVSGGGSVGIGFAVPAATASRIAGELLASGRASHPWAGFTAAEISAQVAARFGSPAGLYVQQVAQGGPAAAAGLRPGDLITRLGGNPASSQAQSHLLLTSHVGDTVTLTVVRGAAQTDVLLVLAEQP